MGCKDVFFEKVNKYSCLSGMYDRVDKTVLIPKSTLDEKEDVREAVFSLLSEPQFLNDDGQYENWALEVHRSEEGVYISIRDVVSTY